MKILTLAFVVLLLIVQMSTIGQASQGSTCGSNPLCRQFDFWVGHWEVFGKNGQRAGDSQVELILDSCVLLENYKNTAGSYAGKSFNLYNHQLNQWQQTWVDDQGGINEYYGLFDQGRMTITTRPFEFSKDTMALRRMTFYPLEANKVRQHGEISKDNGKVWATEYDLEYRRKTF